MLNNADFKGAYSIMYLILIPISDFYKKGSIKLKNENNLILVSQ